MKTKLFFTVAALLGVTFSYTASAVPINGTIAFDGSVSVDSGIPTATSFLTFSATKVSTGTQSGDYLGTGGVTVPTFNGFQFSPVLNPDPVSPLWAFSTGGLDYSFVLDSLVSVTRTSLGAGLYQLSVAGTGMARITGFDDTEGSFSITTTGNLAATDLGFGAFTFAAGQPTDPGQPVPEAGSTAILLGLASLLTCGTAFRGRR